MRCIKPTGKSRWVVQNRPHIGSITNLIKNKINNENFIYVYNEFYD